MNKRCILQHIYTKGMNGRQMVLFILNDVLRQKASIKYLFKKQKRYFNRNSFDCTSMRTGG